MRDLLTTMILITLLALAVGFAIVLVLADISQGEILWREVS